MTWKHSCRIRNISFFVCSVILSIHQVTSIESGKSYDPDSSELNAVQKTLVVLKIAPVDVSIFG